MHPPDSVGTIPIRPCVHTACCIALQAFPLAAAIVSAASTDLLGAGRAPADIPTKAWWPLQLIRRPPRASCPPLQHRILARTRPRRCVGRGMAAVGRSEEPSARTIRGSRLADVLRIARASALWPSVAILTLGFSPSYVTAAADSLIFPALGCCLCQRASGWQ